MTRQDYLSHHLRPITWSLSMPIEHRKRMVLERHGIVSNIKPFLTEEELSLVRQWELREGHEGLWE